MRLTVLALALLAAGCGKQPPNEAVIDMTVPGVERKPHVVVPRRLKDLKVGESACAYVAVDVLSNEHVWIDERMNAWSPEGCPDRLHVLLERIPSGWRAVILSGRTADGTSDIYEYRKGYVQATEVIWQ